MDKRPLVKADPSVEEIEIVRHWEQFCGTRFASHFLPPAIALVIVATYIACTWRLQLFDSVLSLILS